MWREGLFWKSWDCSCIWGAERMWTRRHSWKKEGPVVFSFPSCVSDWFPCPFKLRWKEILCSVTTYPAAPGDRTHSPPLNTITAKGGQPPTPTSPKAACGAALPSQGLLTFPDRCDQLIQPTYSPPRVFWCHIDKTTGWSGSICPF